jgi:hypothetical protein
VKLQAQIWCPLEVWSPHSTSSQTNNHEAMTTTTTSSPPSSSLKRDSLSDRLIRKECEELLSSIPENQLEEVRNLLRNIRDQKFSEHQPAAVSR